MSEVVSRVMAALLCVSPVCVPPTARILARPQKLKAHSKAFFESLGSSLFGWDSRKSVPGISIPATPSSHSDLRGWKCTHTFPDDYCTALSSQAKSHHLHEVKCAHSQKIMTVGLVNCLCSLVGESLEAHRTLT